MPKRRPLSLLLLFGLLVTLIGYEVIDLNQYLFPRTASKLRKLGQEVEDAGSVDTTSPFYLSLTQLVSDGKVPRPNVLFLSGNNMCTKRTDQSTMGIVSAFNRSTFTGMVHIWCLQTALFGYDVNLSLVDNIEKKFGSRDFFDLLYLDQPTWEDYEVLRELSAVRLMRSHESDKENLQFVTDHIRQVNIAAFSYPHELFSFRHVAAGRVFVHSHQGADKDTFYAPYSSARRYDVSLVGASGKSLYPLRNVYREISDALTEMGINVFVYERPPFYLDHEHLTVEEGLQATNTQYQKYAAAMKSARICPMDTSIQRYSVMKYAEAALAGCLIIGNIPNDRPWFWRQFVVEISMRATKESVIGKIQYWLSHEEERLARTKLAQKLCLRSCSWDNSAISLLYGYHLFKRGRPGIYIGHDFQISCQSENHHSFNEFCPEGYNKWLLGYTPSTYSIDVQRFMKHFKRPLELHLGVAISPRFLDFLDFRLHHYHLTEKATFKRTKHLITHAKTHGVNIYSRGRKPSRFDAVRMAMWMGEMFTAAGVPSDRITYDTATTGTAPLPNAVSVVYSVYDSLPPNLSDYSNTIYVQAEQLQWRLPDHPVWDALRKCGSTDSCAVWDFHEAHLSIARQHQVDVDSSMILLPATFQNVITWGFDLIVGASDRERDVILYTEQTDRVKHVHTLLRDAGLTVLVDVQTNNAEQLQTLYKTSRVCLHIHTDDAEGGLDFIHLSEQVQTGCQIVAEIASNDPVQMTFLSQHAGFIFAPYEKLPEVVAEVVASMKEQPDAWRQRQEKVHRLWNKLYYEARQSLQLFKQ